ncbi:isochorismate synthase [Effusibacillus dendaii]|uniref:isochorismate synthase n=1 Tax=Effusibacillus dendaii TaxID=2743772 RepID=A0A7I8D8H3_9BACL|nr:isochorismate synthase [Effusibacillus dendaii]BCJ86307.1 isochorismate synthase [Effusibacillus dendaii]
MVISNLMLTNQQQLQQFLARGIKRATALQRQILCSFTTEAPVFDAVEIFRSGMTLVNECMYWSTPDRSLRLTGIGSAVTAEANGTQRWRQITQQLKQIKQVTLQSAPAEIPGTGPLWLGGFSFDPLQPNKDEIWRAYPDAQLMIPGFLFTVSNNRYWITVNVMVGASDDACKLADELIKKQYALLNGSSESNPTREPQSPAALKVDQGDAAYWKQAVSQAVDKILQNQLQKTVLARKVLVRSEQPFRPADVLRNLLEMQPDCYHFAISRGSCCFLGATPERLTAVQGSRVDAACLAGSIARGNNETEDRELAEYLRNDMKNRAEHAFVVDMLQHTLEPFCETVQAKNQPELMKLQYIQHLYTPVTGTLKPNETILSLLPELHPTPAVGGFPREEAIQQIRILENMDRGWYASPIGWVDSQGNGEYAVALRSALIDNRDAWLFAGCGIVADSNPEDEYAETCLKLRPMLSALGGHHNEK